MAHREKKTHSYGVFQTVIDSYSLSLKTHSIPIPLKKPYSTFTVPLFTELSKSDGKEEEEEEENDEEEFLAMVFLTIALHS